MGLWNPLRCTIQNNVFVLDLVRKDATPNLFELLPGVNLHPAPYVLNIRQSLFHFVNHPASALKL
jgi:hypothetical protein